MRVELADTLVALLGGLPDQDGHVRVSEIDLSVPVEVTTGLSGGQVRVWAHPPHSRWRTGVLPPVHQLRLRVVAEDEAGQP